MSTTLKRRDILLQVGLTAVGLHVLAVMCSAEEGLWLPAAEMTSARVALGATVVDGKLVAVGGATAFPNSILSSIEEYDPATNMWAPKSEMPTARRWVTAATAGEKIYTFGGEQLDSRAMPIVEEYDIPTDTWTTARDMRTPRKGAAAATVGGKVYVIGGADANNNILTAVDMYDLATGAWERKTSMPTARALLSTSVLDDKIYVFGGGPFNVTGAVEVYDTVTDTWTRKTSMPTARYGLATSVADGMIFAMGGHNGSSPTSAVEKYDPVADQWTVTAPLPTPSFGLASAAMDSQVYAIGGTPEWIETTGTPAGVGNVYRYDAGLSRPIVELSTQGEAYSQSFDDVFGPDGTETGIMLPSGWLGTTEHNYEIVDGQFSTTRTLRSGNFYNAGPEDKSDRALATRVPRTERQGDGGTLEFRGTVQGNGATQMRLQFDLEAWGAKSLSSSAPAGEAAFQVVAEVDSGDGFEKLLDLGTISTGPTLLVPEDSVINGNKEAFRSQYDSGWLNHVTIPKDSTLRLRWIADTNETTRGWTFGLDNVQLELGILGDVNRDGKLSVEDVDLVSGEVWNPSDDPVFDLNNDDSVDRNDVDHLLGLTNRLNGDADFDGEVQFSDFLLLSNNFGQNKARWSGGDFDADGLVGFPDFLILSNNFGKSALTGASVPEPSSLVMLAVAMIATLRCRR